MTRRRFPAIPGDLGRNTIARMKELLEIWSGDRGDQLDRVATLRDLIGADIARVTRRGHLEASPGPQPDPVRIGPLSKLTASGAFQNIILEWEGTNQPGYAYTEVWRAEVDNLGEAVMVGASRGFMFTDPVGPGSSYYYWVRAVSTTAHPGPYNASAGTLGETAPDVEYLLDKLEGEITESQLYADLNSRIDLIDDNETGLVTRTDVLETETSAQATSINQLQASVDGNTAAIETKAEVSAVDALEGELAPISAQWTVKTQVNDLVGGIGLYNDGQQTMFAVNANRFYITDDGTVPFVVDEGRTIIRDALIADGAITRAKIGNAAVDSARIADATIETAKIQNAAITSAKITDAAITRAKIGYAEIDTLRVADQAITASQAWENWRRRDVGDTYTSAVGPFVMTVPDNGVDAQHFCIFQYQFGFESQDDVNGFLGYRILVNGSQWNTAFVAPRGRGSVSGSFGIYVPAGNSVSLAIEARRDEKPAEVYMRTGIISVMQR